MTTSRTTTTVFEVSFNAPHEFLQELEADLRAKRVPDNIVRITVRKTSATRRDVSRGIEHNDIPMPAWRMHVVEASYVNGSGQLVKLSFWAGFVYDEAFAVMNSDKALPGRDPTNETLKRQSEVLGELARAITGTELEVRGGALRVEQGAWSATPYELVETESHATGTCATCGEPIYHANKDWRHETSGQTEVNIVHPCSICNGTKIDKGRRCQPCFGTGERKELHHLAHPTEEGRKV